MSRILSYILYAGSAAMMLYFGINLLVTHEFNFILFALLPIMNFVRELWYSIPLYGAYIMIGGGVLLIVVGAMCILAIVMMILNKDKKSLHISNIVLGLLASSWIVLITAIVGLIGFNHHRR